MLKNDAIHHILIEINNDTKEFRKSVFAQVLIILLSNRAVHLSLFKRLSFSFSIIYVLRCILALSQKYTLAQESVLTNCDKTLTSE